MKGERRDKQKNNVFMIGYAEPQPILSKIVQIEYNAKNELAYFFMTAKTLQLLVEARFIVPGSSTLHKSTHETQ